MTDRPTSVVICTRQHTPVLARIVEQLRGQDYDAPYEVLIVDNSASPETGAALRRLAGGAGGPVVAGERDMPVRVVPEPQRGVTLARNRGLHEARHPYLAYLDDDCTIRPDWLAQLMSGFDLDPQVKVVAGRIVLPGDHAGRPRWLGPELERWLAVNGHLSDHARLLEGNERPVEGNMAVERRAWQEAGGFLGMERFGSRAMAASELHYPLAGVRRRGGKVAFVPQAVAEHYVAWRGRRGMLQRAYWQGVSDGLLARLLDGSSPPAPALAYRSARDLAAGCLLAGMAMTAYARRKQSKGMYHSLRAARRIGLALSELRLAGDWPALRAWSRHESLGRPGPITSERI